MFINQFYYILINKYILLLKRSKLRYSKGRGYILENDVQNHILIVDDESFNLDLLEIALAEDTDIKTIRAENGSVALEKVKAHHIDLIILDISMPEVSGLNVLKELKSNEALRYIPVIMVTAKYEERHQSLELGAEDFLTKPIDVKELRFRVQNLLKLKKFNDLQQFFNQRLEEEVAKKEQQLSKFSKVEQELELARVIQQRLVPKSYPKDIGVDVHGVCRQASEVGGDYFDVFNTEDGEHTVFIMADVSGHGFASALVSMQFRALARAELSHAQQPLGETIEQLNTLFSLDNEEGAMFITAVFLRLNHKTRIMESVNAGHFDPLGQPQMKHISGIPLGIQADMPYQALQTPFNTGDYLMLYTDGVVEGENKEGEMYDQAFYNHYEEVKILSAKEQIETIFEAFHDYVDFQADDVTFLAIKAL